MRSSSQMDAVGKERPAVEQVGLIGLGLMGIALAERLFRDIQSPALKLVMDPCNYFRKADLAKMQAMLKDIFQQVGRQTVLAHAKDVKGAANADDTELPASGKGVLDYPLYLRLLAQLDREVYLAVEHLTLPEVPAARDYVLTQFERV